jgi:hypothetical protein
MAKPGHTPDTSRTRVPRIWKPRARSSALNTAALLERVYDLHGAPHAGVMRASRRRTVFAFHCARPVAVGMPRSLSAFAMP